jgi:hypothetical protein
MGVRFVELRVILVLHSSIVDDVADVIAKLRARITVGYQMLNHLLRDIILELAVLHAAGISDDMENHFFLFVDGIDDRGKVISKVVGIGSEAERSRERLKAGVPMAYGI